MKVVEPSRRNGFRILLRRVRPAQQEAGVAIFNKRKANGFRARLRSLPQRSRRRETRPSVPFCADRMCLLRAH
jgi:hypothetical protein